MSPSIPSAPRAELARARVNLTLHVTGRRPDGSHLLESLVAFPQIGDRIAIEPSDRLELVREGPFARDLDGPPESNLILKAIDGFAEATGIPVPDVRITLTKRLPVASGIGGGSSDAASTLRLLEDVTGTLLEDADLQRVARSLGAGVPVCLVPEPQLIRGSGGTLSPGPELPDCGVVLVNPRRAVSKPDVLETMTHWDNPPMPAVPERFESLGDLTGFLETCRNDLQDPAIRICDAIQNVLTVLDAEERIRFARMSGSGATCFGLCQTKDALDVERTLRAAHPHWWVASGPLS
ncbi:4-(cytidine 5'-diphospho)-2-C-methyl-D-erythritol kinase [Roseibium aggregatum]|uniref:4-diphosphocytidyl-2-C-methyl-D-erythritol kinase n=1 Tax=Roseibium aggregatum TaxID=187304 RepID=A0A939EGH5_9HYPH|nr:4-(cytidine 5'-diphospho)-2-C-methyl-D-erythritol kinase [Roseibium aggregatum]MBN9671109.1 4-(cytidine 5'-diphospho)-2-C-methyl-D-erythritol kinase [Roseibium aggregatum]